MAKKTTSRLTKQQQRTVARIQKSGGVVPVGAFGGALPKEQVAERMAHRSSGAAGAHTDSSVRSRTIAAGRTNRVGSRATQRNAAVRDYS